MSKRDQSQLFLTLNSLVQTNHPYRKLDELLCFNLKRLLRVLDLGCGKALSSIFLVLEYGVDY